ncbi:MAG: hypothetical protein ACRENP_09385 [Longimicrobiales bacterium]
MDTGLKTQQSVSQRIIGRAIYYRQHLTHDVPGALVRTCPREHSGEGQAEFCMCFNVSAPAPGFEFSEILHS